MKWLRRKIYNWLQSAPEIITPAEQPLRNRGEFRGEGLSFSIYKANGGHIVETKIYDHKLDRLNTNLHIIREDEDFAECIGKIVYYEALRN